MNTGGLGTWLHAEKMPGNQILEANRPLPAPLNEGPKATLAATLALAATLTLAATLDLVIRPAHLPQIRAQREPRFMNTTITFMVSLFLTHTGPTPKLGTSRTEVEAFMEVRVSGMAEAI
jgi:hypothetical protein